MEDTTSRQTSENFKREERYVVLKIKDLEQIPPALLEELAGILSTIAELPAWPKRSYVVVENDWPEYETVWAMIAQRATKQERLI